MMCQDPPQKCIQPNPWSCYPTVVCHLTGIPFEELIETIGHDGSKIIDSSKGEPGQREAFGYSEMALALLQHGWATVAIYARIEHPNGEKLTAFPEFDDLIGRLPMISDDIIVVAEREGRDHCYAWTPSIDSLVDPLIGENIKTLPDDIPLKYFECLIPFTTL